MTSKNQVIFSGVKPSGDLHIGNYLGAIKQWVLLQDEYDVFFCVVDEHAITVPQDPEELRRRTIEVAQAYLAAGIDPKKSTLFIQSHVPEHAELGWILNTFTPMGELQRMTQYKDAIQKGKPAFAGLFNYPTLMAADILLYHTNLVPVGEDQLQHIELARSLAERFNNRYGETFVVPKPLIKKETARIMSLLNPEEKMSKSDDNAGSFILLTDPPEVIREKIKGAVTDSGKKIIYDPQQKPAISNLLVIFSEFSGKSIDDLVKANEGKTYAAFKQDLANAVVEGLTPFQKKWRDLSSRTDKTLLTLREGAQAARAIASETLKMVKEKVGFVL